MSAISASPDELLTTEHGVYDNWPILFDVTFPEMLALLQSDGKFQLAPEQPWHVQSAATQNRTLLSYIPGTVVAQCLGYITPDERDSPALLQPAAKQYRSSLYLHPYQKEERMPCSSERAIATAICDIAQLVIQQQAATCFPRSCGFKYRADLSRIAYFP